MKNKILEYLNKNSLVYPRYNNNMSREIYWKNRNIEWWKYLSKMFSIYKKNYFKIQFSQFIRLHFYNDKAKRLLNINKTVTEFCKEFNGKSPRKEEHIYQYWQPKVKEYVKKNNLVDSHNFRQLVYNVNHDLKNIPKCKRKECDNEVSFYGDSYRKFCSQTCQIIFKNSPKPAKMAKLPNHIIRKKIKDIAPDARSITNEKMSSFFGNILDYSNSFRFNLEDRERIYIFLNSIKESEITCVCGVKKKFISQQKGYAKTCGKCECIKTVRHPSYYKEDAINSYIAKNGTKTNTGYIYVVKLEKNNYKIGITINPLGRFTQYKNFEDYKIIFCNHIKNNLFKLEKELHDIFNTKRCTNYDIAGKTEIFSLTLKDLKKIKKYIYDFE